MPSQLLSAHLTTKPAKPMELSAMTDELLRHSQPSAIASSTTADPMEAPIDARPDPARRSDERDHLTTPATEVLDIILSLV
jgi:hypothetical protein